MIEKASRKREPQVYGFSIIWIMKAILARWQFELDGTKEKEVLGEIKAEGSQVDFKLIPGKKILDPRRHQVSVARQDGIEVLSAKRHGEEWLVCLLRDPPPGYFLEEVEES